MDDTIYGGIQTLNVAATLLLKLACVYALVSVSTTLRHWRQRGRPTVVLQPPVETLTAPTVETLPAAKPTFPPNSMMDQMVQAMVRKETVAPPPPPAPEEIIECGHCGKEIKASPLTSMFVDKKNYLIFQCEHCQTQVKLAAN